MDKSPTSLLIGLAAGAIGYWFTTFWMKPILRYRELRSNVFADFIFYAQVVNADGLNDRMKQLYEERVSANRRNSAALAACIQELPFWYKWWLRIRGQSPDRAARLLIGYSNTTDYDNAGKISTGIQKALGIRGYFEQL